MKYRVLDLFSGIGGFSLGLERTGGFETVAFCEIEPFCRRVLAKHWPEVPCYDDVRTLTAERLAADGIAVDVICGGFPCQDISDAGRRVGIEGARSGLWSEIARLAGELRPDFIVVENVAALLSRGLGTVLGDLATLGFDAEWHCVPAYYAGADQQRDRVWILAYPEGSQEGSAVARYCGGEADRGWALKASQAGGRTGLRGWQDRVAEPRMGRVVDGFPGCVDRLAALGNAVVPQIPELIGRAILQAEAQNPQEQNT